MRPGKILSVLVLAAALLFSSAAVYSADDKTKYPYTFKDVLGRTAVLKKAPKRIISIAPATTEILYALGLGSKIVAVSSYCDYPADTAKKEKVGAFNDPNIEKIISLQPDIVFGAAGVSVPALKQLDDLGIPSYVSDARTISGTMDTILDIARVTDTLAEGKELVASMKKRVEKITSKTSKLPASKKPKVFYEQWNNPLMTAGPRTFIDDMIVMAGGINIAGDSKVEWPAYSLEVLVQKNPDIILHASAYYPVSEIKSRKGWNVIKAVKTGNIVHLPDENVVSRPSYRIVEGLEDIAKAIHPELFK